LLTLLAVLAAPACVTAPPGTVHGSGENPPRRHGDAISKEVPHSEETMKDTRDDEARNPPADNVPKVAPYPESPPPVELPPFPKPTPPPKDQG